MLFIMRESYVQIMVICYGLQCACQGYNTSLLRLIDNPHTSNDLTSLVYAPFLACPKR